MTNVSNNSLKTNARPNQVRRYNKGDVVFEENSFGRELYIIQSGKVAVYKDSPEGRLELAVIQKGGVIGEMSLLDNLPRSATVIAVEPTEAIVINQLAFQRILQQVPPWLSSIIKIVVSRLRDTNRRIGLSALRDKERGLISLILLLLPVYKKELPAAVGIDYNLIVAEAFFVSRLRKKESVRLLEQFERREVIKIDTSRGDNDKMIIVEDMEILRLYEEYLNLKSHNRSFYELAISEDSIAVFSNIAYVAQKSGTTTEDGVALDKSELVSDLVETTPEKLEKSLLDLRRRGLINIMPGENDSTIIFDKEVLSRIKKIKKMLPFFTMEVS